MATNSAPVSDKDAYDVIVIGGGLMGASTAAALSDEGKRVLLLDANDKHHELGSSHGQARASRVGYESKAFPQMARDSLNTVREEFPDVAIKPMPTLFVTTENSPTHQEFNRFAHAQQIQQTTLSSGTVKERYGLPSLPEDQIGILEENSATFNPHTLLDKLYEKIEANGGSVQFSQAVAEWQSREDGVSVKVGDSSIQAKQLMVAAGAWTPEVLKHGRGSNISKRTVDRLSDAMVIERTPVFYFEYPKNMPDTIFLEYAGEGSAIDGGLPGKSSGDNLELWAVPEVLRDGTKIG